MLKTQKYRNQSIIAAIAAAALAIFPVAYASELVEQQIAERIAPIGEVCVEGDACAAAAPVVSSGPRTAEQIYTTNCTTCHSIGVAGAPKFGDLAQWQPRIDNGLEALYANSINGINAMPAKGLCMDCSDDEIKATVDYMVEAAK